MQLIAQLSLELDNLHADKDSSVPSVIVIAATNFPEYIDKSFLRPGRFERLVYVPPPDNVRRVHAVIMNSLISFFRRRVKQYFWRTSK
jgi:transitional endoplasmic reticulum ATPase